RRAAGFPPFGGLAEVTGAAAAVEAACTALRSEPGLTVLGPVTAGGGARALVKSATASALADALAGVDLSSARALGRVRVAVDPLRV
ncbi:MAG: primosome assembly protein PriA, partial [Acidimicrobiia bacterium]